MWRMGKPMSPYNAILGVPITTGLISGTEAHVDWPIDNLLRVEPTDVYRQKVAGPCHIEYDLGQPEHIIFASLAFSNADTNTLIRLRAATTQALLTTAPAWDSEWVPFWCIAGLGDWNRTHNFQFPDREYQWWRFDADHPSGTCQFGNLILCKKWQSVCNFELPLTRDFAEAYRESTNNINRHRGPGRRERSETLSFPVLPAEELELSRVIHERGATKPVFYIESPADPDRLMLSSYYGHINGFQTSRVLNVEYMAQVQLIEKEYP